MNIYHLNGFKPGNLQISESVRKPTMDPATVNLPSEVDVLIVDCGPAGPMLARPLAELSGIKACIIDHKSGPMLFGQVDSAFCRSIELSRHSTSAKQGTLHAHAQ